MAQTRRLGMQNERTQLHNAPRPPTQASARPSLKGLLTERRGRDVGFAESGFRPTIMGSRARRASNALPYRFVAAPARSGFLPNCLLPGQDLFGLSKQRNTEVVQLLRTLQL